MMGTSSAKTGQMCIRDSLDIDTENYKEYLRGASSLAPAVIDGIKDE